MASNKPSTEISNAESLYFNYIPKTGDLILFFPSLLKITPFRALIMSFSCSPCDHIAIIYKDVPEIILKSRLKSQKSPSNTYVLEFDKPQGLMIFAYENYIDNQGKYYFKSLINSNTNLNLDSPKIKQKLDQYLLNIYQTSFSSYLNLFKGVFSLNTKDDRIDIYCGQFVTELLQEGEVISKTTIANNIIPKDYYNSRMMYINGYNYNPEELMIFY
jgi:hypothetical protein